ncbi:hypothetical protein LEP1GSC161_3374 [Leptospira santarosai str. CBC1416]|uniref:Uncharacterized protein n=2 Tax=Leptospira santarosai TaxID=28183 RepID=A0A0E2BFX5_9LEPT|nr:hypothetical protein LEP1GSC179_1763 [Leptospira santarosai str. MOR084]EKR93073.1 hypothetical protein LEP1GSC163_0994 [Leptospira santarosai str. CBC379]EMO59806.1 hypothetical protein LEP1GSC161_3374 [Leptospira santarosai str. CBC1416]
MGGKLKPHCSLRVTKRGEVAGNNQTNSLYQKIIIFSRRIFFRKACRNSDKLGVFLLLK